jgi:hypothetical protein
MPIQYLDMSEDRGIEKFLATAELYSYDLLKKI